MAARFCLFTDNLSEASRLAEKLLNGKSVGPQSSVFEVEAHTVLQWCAMAEADLMQDGDTGLDSSTRKQLQAIDDSFNSTRSNEQLEMDCLLLWARTKILLGRTVEAVNVYNQVSPLIACCNDAVLTLTLNKDEWMDCYVLDHRHVSAVLRRSGRQGAAARLRVRMGPGIGHRTEAVGRGAR